MMMIMVMMMIPHGHTPPACAPMRPKTPPCTYAYEYKFFIYQNHSSRGGLWGGVYGVGCAF